MRTLIVALLFIAGGLTSYNLIRESKAKCRDASRIFTLASKLEEEIRYTRSPVGEILHDDFDVFANSSDEHVRCLIDGICTKEYDAALASAVLLKNYTEKEMQRVTENEERLKKIKYVMPVAASALLAILLI